MDDFSLPTKEIGSRNGIATGGSGFQDSKESLIVALDFGTTYSGVAYAFSSKPDHIYFIKDWPGAKGKEYPKCPTLIKYETPKKFEWGFGLDRTSPGCIEWIKLLLDADQSRPLYIPPKNMKSELEKLNKDVHDVATDFIHAIFEYAMSKIKEKYPKSYVDGIAKQYILTVPAIWSEKAQKATLDMAKAAGMSPVKLIKEPEAAALYTIKDMSKRGLEVGDALVICDAGGGTVDLISYEITNMDPLQMKELVEGKGALAGSLMINHRFAAWVKSIVGDKAFLDLQGRRSYLKAMDTFNEIVKPAFLSKDDEEQLVIFPKANLEDIPAKGLESDLLTIPGSVLYDIFDPVVRVVDDLINEQIMEVRSKRAKDTHPKDVNAIFLVGGFGSNAYLHDFISKAHRDIQVIRPNDAWSAIVRGAVMSELSNQASVISNVALKHYGVSGASPYDEAKDFGQDMIWDSYEEIYRASRMTWYIHKGDDLIRSRKLEFPFYNQFEPYPSSAQLQVRCALLECSLEEASLHPTLVKGTMKQNCYFYADLSSIPTEMFTRRRRRNGTGAEYWELHYELIVSIQSGPMVFSIQCGGKDYGQVEAKY